MSEVKGQGGWRRKSLKQVDGKTTQQSPVVGIGSTSNPLQQTQPEGVCTVHSPFFNAESNQND
jgi:hypothetical protein